MFCVVFAYSVAGDREAFERAYGPDGEWAAFFGADEGYVATELLASDDGYLLIDRWRSREAYERFLAAHREEYDRRAAEAERLYATEERVGAFHSLAAGAGSPAGALAAGAAAPPAGALPAGAALRLGVLPGTFAVCRLAADAPTPPRFWSVTRTDDELSVICAEADAPAGAAVQAGWRGLQVAGPLDFALTGVAAALTVPLAAAGISVLPVATYDTDYLFVREDDLARATAALTAAGHTVS